MNGIAVYKTEADPRSLSRQTARFVSAPKVHTQPIPLTTAQFTIQPFILRSLVQPNTTYYRLIQPNTGHKKIASCTANHKRTTSKQERATRIKPNQGKSNQIKVPFFIKPPNPSTTTTIMTHLLMKGKER
jgi:hypothetical protein